VDDKVSNIEDKIEKGSERRKRSEDQSVSDIEDRIEKGSERRKRSEDQSVSDIEDKIEKGKERRKRSEDQSTVESVFDTETLKVIYDLYNHKVLDEIGFIISTGKEANVYYAVGPQGEDFALKIYRIKTAEPRFMWPYVIGDKRFKKIKRKTRDLVFTWAQKEYKNLSRAKEANVRVPTPIAVRKNVLVMEFIGKDGNPAPLLKDCTLKRPQQVFDKLMEYVKLLFQNANLIHGDLSEFNIIFYLEEPIIIDISQGVLTDHPDAKEFLLRDIKNLLRYFSVYKINIPGLSEAYNYVTGLDLNDV
jgi:RIO kinase 1